MQDCSDAKKPCKGILKTSSSFDRPSASYRKSAKFDELNVLKTFHPPDKDYGHMPINEPKTPFNYDEPDLDTNDGGLDADLLAEKLRIAANTRTPSFGDENLSDDEFPETHDEKVHRLEFEKRRKMHYNEFEAVRLARKLMEEELQSEEEEEASGTEDQSARSLNEPFEPHAAEEEAVSEDPIKHEKKKPCQKTGDAADVVQQRAMEVDLQPHPCAGRGRRVN